ncbi:M56 family metallopeptidase [Chitinophaga rhizosphaerae]|uniref:M56 family metallopeptidase n=1 Tax=Chitinophaga rhizosphaerae TaxID=1864947 RepID=UPI000F811A5B|nr:M56 family metallopeptidase [Chitinophaga rhizosphaerae]
MSLILMYLAKAALCSGLLFAYYCLVLRNQRQHRWNRAYLLGLTAVSLLLPLISIPLPGSTTGPAAILQYTASAFTVNGNAGGHTAGSWHWSFFAYAAVAAALLARFGYAVWQLRNLIRGGRRQAGQHYQLILHPAVSSPFSFFRFIFWNPDAEQQSAESRHILQHEQTHVRKGHSWDTLFMELVTALCWANPIFHFVKRELQVVHEFEADEVPAGNGQTKAYTENLLRQVLCAPSANLLIHHFSQPPVKRRIMMLTRKNNTRFAAVRKLMTLPLAAGLIFAISCTQNKQDVKVPEAAPSYPQKEKEIEYVEQPKYELFTQVEEPPVFPGGDAALNKYLGNNINYPKAAMEGSVQGTVIVQFTIRRDGTIKDVTTVGKKIGSGLEEESIRVVKGMPKWKPGVQNKRQVDVRFNLPIRYTLQDEDNSTSFWPGQSPFMPGQKTTC